MLGDIQTDILAFVNGRLKTNDAVDDEEFTSALQSCLDDLSKLDALVNTDSSQTLAADDTYLVYPANYRSIITIVLINSSGVRQAPLLEIPGGHEEFEELRDNDTTTGTPAWFDEYDDKFWLWRPANGVFTSEIKHLRNHPAGQLDNILFGDDFKNAVLFGATYYKALFSKRNTDIANWKPIFEEERDKMSLEVEQEPYITRG